MPHFEIYLLGFTIEVMPLHRLFFYLTVLLLPTQLGIHFFPDWALVLGRRLDYLSPTVYLTDITIFLTLSFWFLSRKKFHLLFIGRWYYWILVLFVVLNIILATSPFVALSKWLKVLEFVLFGFYIVKTKPSFSRTLWCLSIAVLYSSIIAIAQFFLQHSVGGLLWFLGERTFDITTPGIARIGLQPSVFSYQTSEVLRPYATFPHPNVAGGFLAVILPVVIYNNITIKQFNNCIKNLLKIFRVATITLGSLALILTFSRSAWLAFIILFVFLTISNFNFIKNFKFPLDYARGGQISNYLFVGFVVLVVFVGLLLMLPYFQSLTINSESVFVRSELATAALSIWKTSPLIGVGLGNFLVHLPSYYPHREIFFLQPVHNIYLLLLSETGIIGICLLLFFLWKLYKHITRKCFIGIWNLLARRSLGADGAFVTLLLLGLVDHYPLTLQQGQLLLTILISFSARPSLGKGV